MFPSPLYAKEAYGRESDYCHCGKSDEDMTLIIGTVGQSTDLDPVLLVE
jgi:hypothetical protein